MINRKTRFVSSADMDRIHFQARVFLCGEVGCLSWKVTELGEGVRIVEWIQLNNLENEVLFLLIPAAPLGRGRRLVHGNGKIRRGCRSRCRPRCRPTA